MTTTVVHVSKPYDIYIGRRNGPRGLPDSRWRNPLRISAALTREAVIDVYEMNLRRDIRAGKVTRQDLESLQGKVLGCWCAPEPCHGDVLARYADNAMIVTLDDYELFRWIEDLYDAPMSQARARRDALLVEFMARVGGILREE